MHSGVSARGPLFVISQGVHLQWEWSCRMSMHKGGSELHRPAGQLPLAKLVECLQKLGGVGEAQLTFRRHMPTQASQLKAVTTLIIP